MRTVPVCGRLSMSEWSSLSSLTHLDTLIPVCGRVSMSEWSSLSSLTHLDTLIPVCGRLSVSELSIWIFKLTFIAHSSALRGLKIISLMEYDNPGLWKALHGLNIKSLSLSDYADSMSQSLSSLTHLDTLSIEADYCSTGLLEALRVIGMDMTVPVCGRLSMSELLNEDNADSISQSLSSLTHLDTLSIKVNEDSPGLWKALHGLNIISLIDYCSPGLWEALRV
ncbi:hypothetical protein DPMN_060024 [Dreissena polymorpha]|uniref:Uncharacterized protein n=1 Tax=Dreissena polymorpha TaxID=45954 RepID=A0A9D4HFK5_DREPO|nr:hypothetical protein DPMN_060024 [Dreissena polymorpha]